MERISIEILKWNEFQPRSDLKSTPWLRLDSDIFNSEMYFFLGNEGMIIFIFLLTTAAKNNSSKFDIAIDYITGKIGLKKQAINECIEKLERLQILHRSDQIRAESCTTNERTNVTNERNETNVTSTSVPVRTDQHGCLPELSLHEISTELFSKVKPETQRGWLAAYPNAQWICHEALKANIWMNENPKKRPKVFGKFFSNWLSNSFESYRKGIPSNSKNKSFTQQAEDKAVEMMRKFEQEGSNES